MRQMFYIRSYQLDIGCPLSAFSATRSSGETRPADSSFSSAISSCSRSLPGRTSAPKTSTTELNWRSDKRRASRLLRRLRCNPESHRLLSGGRKLLQSSGRQLVIAPMLNWRSDTRRASRLLRRLRCNPESHRLLSGGRKLLQSSGRQLVIAPMLNWRSDKRRASRLLRRLRCNAESHRLLSGGRKLLQSSGRQLVIAPMLNGHSDDDQQAISVGACGSSTPKTEPRAARTTGLPGRSP